MSSSPSTVYVYGDLLDYLLHAYGETKEQWDAPFDAAPTLPTFPAAALPVPRSSATGQARAALRPIFSFSP